MYGAYANLNDLVDFSEGVGDELFNRMEAIFEVGPEPEADQFLPLHFAYAKALDDRGQHEKALEHYIIGGKMKRAQLEYKEDETFGFFDAIRAAFPKEVFENRKFDGHRRRAAGVHRRHAALGLDPGRADPFEPPRHLWRRRGQISQPRARPCCATASRRCRNIRR